MLYGICFNKGQGILRQLKQPNEGSGDTCSTRRPQKQVLTKSTLGIAEKLTPKV